MTDKNKPVVFHDFQEPSVKKAKRIASIIYIGIMAFIVGGTYLHQQQKESNKAEQLVEFNNP